ncbi:hypothetical protein [Herbaspirillum rubrisubalbicans]|uniref:Uncharacterized protein n=1 Tax=Herbaspirillum rubrisubalbicans TaxID=80842 RepID=A0ABX9BX93_9BURK|nr:hypothetical protein [Herbaspirillum rubrisubalbicans]RAM62559.1 hypothetical protein RB24_19795 [Herbaspirillum rubrisubalbicans]
MKKRETFRDFGAYWTIVDAVLAIGFSNEELVRKRVMLREFLESFDPNSSNLFDYQSDTAKSLAANLFSELKAVEGDVKKKRLAVIWARWALRERGLRLSNDFSRELLTWLGKPVQSQILYRFRNPETSKSGGKVRKKKSAKVEIGYTALEVLSLESLPLSRPNETYQLRWTRTKPKSKMLKPPPVSDKFLAEMRGCLAELKDEDKATIAVISGPVGYQYKSLVTKKELLGWWRKRFPHIGKRDSYVAKSFQFLMTFR